jgi:lipopolysaccharide export LptBFGC system permease protein LptF
MESLQSGKDMTLIDAFETWKLLKKQKMETSKIRATIYEKIIFPLFVFGAIIILFFKIPSYARFANSSLVSALAIGGTLVLWGLLMGLGRLGAGSIIPPEIAYGLPVIIISIYSFYLFMQKEKLS